MNQYYPMLQFAAGMNKFRRLQSITPSIYPRLQDWEENIACALLYQKSLRTLEVMVSSA
jgi:hypothetical protein